MERLCYDIISEIALLAAAGCHSRGAWRVVGRHADRRAASPSPPVVCGVHPGGAASSRPNSVDAQSSRDFGRLFQLNSGHDVSSCRFGWLRRTGSLDRCPARRLRRAARRFGRKSAFAERMPSALECPARSNAQRARMPNALECPMRSKAHLTRGCTSLLRHACANISPRPVSPPFFQSRPMADRLAAALFRSAT